MVGSSHKSFNPFARIKRLQCRKYPAGFPAGFYFVHERLNGMRRVRFENNNFLLEFPYSLGIIQDVRELPGRAWKPDKKAWAVPVSSEAAKGIFSLAQAHGFKLDDTALDVVADLLAKAEVLGAHSAKVTNDFSLSVTLGQELFPYQVSGVGYALLSKRCFIGDEMGLGKSAQALAACEQGKLFPAVIVCPASLKTNWKKEVTKWLPKRHAVMVANSKEDVPALIRYADVIIVNYELLITKRKQDEKGKPLFPVGEAIREAMPKAIILDESHYIKNPDALRTKACVALGKGVEYLFCLSGTPVTNKPIEFVGQLKFLGRLDQEFGGYWQFVKRYCFPPDAPVWMGDYSFKPIAEVKVGDYVIGWKQNRIKRGGGETTQGKQTLCRAKVLETFKRESEIVKVTFASGRVVYCTPDHKWLSFQHNSKYPYTVAAPGRTLCHVVDLPIKLPNNLLHTAGWLGGIFDGEGTGTRISQCAIHNPEVCKRIEDSLTALEIPFTYSQKADSFYITEGRKGLLKFLFATRPTKINKHVDKSVLVSDFRTPDKVVSVEPYSKGEVRCIRTETGNFVAYGYATKNCGAKQTAYGWDFSGASHTHELNQRLRESCYIRRLKSDVLKELPDKTAQTVYFSFDLKDYKKNTAGAVDALYAGASHLEADLHIAAMKKEAALAKLPAVIEWIQEFLDSGRKLVVFAWHREVIKQLREAFPGKSVSIAGDTSTVIDKETGLNDRQRAVDAFQNDEGIRLFIGNIRAAGVGITLTAASDVAFVEFAHTPAEHEQAEDRCHRIGQKNAVTAYYLVGEGTIDEEIIESLGVKQEVVAEVSDGVHASMKNRTVMKNILARLKEKEEAVTA